MTYISRMRHKKAPAIAGACKFLVPRNGLGNPLPKIALFLKNQMFILN